METSDGLPPPLDGASGRYIAERELGRGSSGITYLCRRVSDSAPFVLKELRLSMIEEWKSLDLFEREVATLRTLDHPGIPAYVDAVLDREQGRFALVQEYIDGRTLDEVAKASESLSQDQFRAYLRDALEVLAYLHARLPPVVHRDIKPRNLMICEGRLFLIDFGAVRLAFTESTTTTSVGTFGYMAPEQIRGRAEPASDLFSLGMTFICLATRRQPENLPVDPESGQIDPRSLLSLPQELSELLLAMIEPGLRNRLGSATEALARLDPKAVATVEPPAAPRQRPRPGNTLRRPARILGVLLALVFTGGYIASRIADEGEIRTLGGWFSGHGSSLASIQLTLLGDAYGIHSLWVHALAFSPDGEVLASAADDELILWRVDDGELLQRADDDQRLIHVAFSSDGESLVGVDGNGKVSVYDPETAQLRRTLSTPSIASDDLGEGHFRVADLWVGSSSEIRVVGLLEPPYVAQGETPRAGAVAENTMVVVDPLAASLLTSTPLRDWRNFNTGALSPDGNRVALAGTLANEAADARYPLVAVDVATGRQLLSTSSSREIREITFASDSELISLDYDGLYRWDLDSGERLGSLGTFDAYYDAHLIVSPARARIALSSYNGIVLVDQGSGDRLGVREGHTRAVHSLAFSPDGSILASGGSDQLIKLWSVP